MRSELRTSNTSESSTVTVTEQPSGLRRVLTSLSGVQRRFGQLGTLLLAFVVLAAFLGIVAPNFLTASNLINVLRQVSMTAIIGVGMTMVIIAGEIDLSVGSLVAFAGVVLASLAVESGLPIPLALLLTLGMGAVLGFLIGFIRMHFNVPSFIITLGLYTALRSGAYTLSNGFPIAPFPAGFDWLGAGFIGPIPVPVIIMFLAYIGGYIILKHTPWGRAIYAVGGNAEASRISGINVKAVKISVFVVTSTLACLAAAILASRLDSGSPTVAGGWELEVIAAVIIGGTGLSGGSGSILGTLLGALFVATLGNGMVILGVSPYVQGIISGMVILAAVLVSAIRGRAAQKS